MAAAMIQPPPPFEAGKKPAEAWEEWRTSYELYEEACEYKTKKPGPRRALLLHVLGPAARKTYKSFVFTPPTATKPQESAEDIMEKFDELYRPYRNVTHASAIFNTIVQKPDQSIDELVAELKIQAYDCDYGDKCDRMVGDRIIVGIRDSALRERLLREPLLSLDKIINLCKSAEISKAQAKTLLTTADNPTVDSIQHKKYLTKNKYGQNKANNKPSPTKGRQSDTCSRCGTHHLPRSCPAYGKHCHTCGRFGHFATVCNQKSYSRNNRQISTLAENTEDESESEIFELGALTIGNIKNSNTRWLQSVCVEGNDVTFKLDTGSDVNILPALVMHTWKIKPKIKTTESKITTYSGEKLQIAGKCELNCTTTDKAGKYIFFITNENYKPILGAHACEDLGLIIRRESKVSIIANMSANPLLGNPQEIIDLFPDVFTGVGKLPGVYKITIRENSAPKIVAPRKIPIALEEKVKNKLERMVKDGIITPVTEPTEWVHPIVIARKKGECDDIRICLDPRQLNEVICREHYRIPNQEELFAKMKGSKIFSLFDASSAFWQLELDKRSSMLCTFATPWGRYRFLRMPFGINCAPEQFQRAMEEIFRGNKNIHPYFDDILLYSKNKEEHNKQIYELLTIARANGLKLNKNKIKLCVSNITYLGHVLSPEGISPDPEKVKAITSLKPPNNTTELMRLLGMITFLTKFIPSFSHETTQLRALLKPNVPWTWDKNTDRQFQRIKHLLTTAPVLRYFDQRDPITISTDASSYGIGSVLLQQQQPIAYASATLTPTQLNWAQIEKELLAIIFACERFQYYVMGTKIQVQTDHKPLIGLFQKPFEKVTPRLQRLLLRLQKFDITLVYVPGKFLNVADALSRAPDTSTATHIPDDKLNLTVCTLIRATTPKLNQIRKETQEDATLKQLAEYISKGWPPQKSIKDKDMKAYYNCKEELHIVDGYICRGQRLILPRPSRQDALDKLHMAHRGIVSCKNKARRVLYWPTMNNEIEKLIATCTICQQYQNNNIHEPLEDRQLPDRPWQQLALDFFHIAGVTYLLIIDYFSKYVELQPMKSTTAKGVINALKAIFARFGLPEEVVSDNGPPMDSEEIRTFLAEWDVVHNPAAPYNPRSNGLAERAVQTLKNSMIKAARDKRDLFMVLMDYRNTPMDGLRSPAELLMGRPIRTFVPALPSCLNPLYDCRATQKKLAQRQARQHNHADRHTRILSPLVINQEVWFALNKGWEPGKIVQVGPQKRSYLIKGHNGSCYRRNRFHIKPATYKSTEAARETTNKEEGSVENYLVGDQKEQLGPETAGNSNRVPGETRSGRRIILPARYREA